MSEVTKADDTRSADSTSLQTYQPDERLTRLFRFFEKLSKDQVNSFRKTKRYVFPFRADETVVRKINEEVLRCFDHDGEVEFSSKTRFQDLSTIEHDNFEKFLSNAGDKKDPESAVLKWSTFLIDAQGNPVSKSVALILVTEKTLETDDKVSPNRPQAYVFLDVGSSDEKWVEYSFRNVSDLVPNLPLGGIYRPLWIFRNHFVVQLLSQFFGMAGGSAASAAYYVLTAAEDNNSTASRREAILKLENIEAKLDALIEYIMTPTETAWFAMVFGLLFFGAGFVLVMLASLSLLPKLTPASSIALGLANRRAEQNENAFRFIVFSVLILGILLPAVWTIIGATIG